MKPEFFDIFGIPVFIFILYTGVTLTRNLPLPSWTPMVLIIIGILGLIIDSFIVIKTYIIK
jgi:hypothetical protein